MGHGCRSSMQWREFSILLRCWHCGSGINAFSCAGIGALSCAASVANVLGTPELGKHMDLWITNIIPSTTRPWMQNVIACDRCSRRCAASFAVHSPSSSLEHLLVPVEQPPATQQPLQLHKQAAATQPCLQAGAPLPLASQPSQISKPHCQMLPGQTLARHAVLAKGVDRLGVVEVTAAQEQEAKHQQRWHASW